MSTNREYLLFPWRKTEKPHRGVNRLMKWWNASKGILGLVAGTKAVQEVNQLAKTAKIALIVLMVFVGFLMLSVLLLDIVLILTIIRMA